MTQEAFIKELERKGYSYSEEGNKIMITDRGGIYLDDLTSLPSVVEFRNGEIVSLASLETLPPGVEFRNGGSVFLDALTSLPSGVEFKNQLSVHLGFLIGGWNCDWEGNIKGIGSNRLLNKMISIGLFNR